MKNTEKAFLWIIDILERNKITYRVSDGLAARAHGVNRELADIDIKVSEKDIPTIAYEARVYVKFGPKRYKDRNWDLELLTLDYGGQEIDIAGRSAKIFNQNTKQWKNRSETMGSVTMMNIFGKGVPVEGIESLVTYKSILGREVDTEDVRQLLAILKSKD